MSGVEGWIDWHGGENPVPGLVVQVQWRDQSARYTPDDESCSDEWKWGHHDMYCDIIAYRVVTPAALSAIEGGGGASAAPIPTEREADSSYQWEAKLLNGQWRVGLKGNLDTVHDATITVHKHGEGDIDQHIAEWVAEVHNAELTPSVPTEQADGGVVGWQPIETHDGSRGSVLVWCAERRNTYTAIWRDDWEAYGEPGWFHFAGIADRLREVPTHWRRLPTPPATPIAGGFGSNRQGADTHRVAETVVVAHSTYLSAVAGRMAFRGAYRRCLPVVRAAEALAVKWMTNGQKVDSDDFYAAIHDVCEAAMRRNGGHEAEDRALAAVAATASDTRAGYEPEASEPKDAARRDEGAGQ